ncbi:solute-binding protein [Saccharibacillus endophyticus]|uniref:Solute-binding protein n=2 Tax=Saccharibacillus endophyticus TaxID=2060666 RepID=A0ABQ1ZIR7_9BACL|nr:extracellular solute-binding protein [Saccharibacillus endophyticus]GGH68275.1 solute-binding protein [Saccharibacillus endophyticus]
MSMFSKKGKRWMTGLSALTVTLLLSACSGGSGGPAAQQAGGGETSETTGGQTELRMMWWGDQKRADTTNQAIKLFEQKNPDIKVMGEFAPSTGYFDKLNTQLASGTAPDVFFLGGNVTDYASKGVLLDLTPYVGNELKLEQMDQSLVEYGTLGGKLVNVSAGANARGIVVNKTLFEKAGMPIPEDGWNWDDYARISKELSDKLDGVAGTYNFTFDGMDIFLKQNGKQLYDMENEALGFEEADILPWYQYWDETTQNGGVVSPEMQVSNPPNDTAKTLLITSGVGMTLIPSNQLAAFQNLTEDELILVQVPRGPKGTGVVFESSQGLSAYAKTEHPEAVAKLIDFWINDADAAKILGSDRGVPVTAANRELLQKDASPADLIVYDYTSRVSEAAEKENFVVSYNIPGGAEFTKLGETTVQEIGFGRKSVEQAVSDFYKGAQQIFAKNKTSAQ